MSVTRHPLRAPVGPLRGVPLDLALVERLETNILGLAGREARLLAAFDAALARDAPDLAGRWRDAPRQRSHLLAALGLFVWHLRAEADAGDHARRLVGRLERCGFGAADRATMKRALLAALAEASGPRWSATLEADWRETLELALATAAARAADAR